MLWRERRAVERAEIGRVLPGLVLGVAGPVMRVVDEDALGLLFGGLVLLAVGLSLGRRPATGRRVLFAAGFLDRHWLRAAVLLVSALAAVAAIVRALF